MSLFLAQRLKQRDETRETNEKCQQDSMKRVIAAVESCFRYLLATLYVFAANGLSEMAPPKRSLRRGCSRAQSSGRV